LYADATPAGERPGGPRRVTPVTPATNPAFIGAGGDLVELSAHLGHRDPSVTASTYSHEFEKAARSEQRRARLHGLFVTQNGGPYGSLVEANGRGEAQQTDDPATAEVADLQAKRGAAR
jgi:hypothetical protein